MMISNSLELGDCREDVAYPVWAKQLTRLPCLVVYAKFQFVYTTFVKAETLGGKACDEVLLFIRKDTVVTPNDI